MAEAQDVSRDGPRAMVAGLLLCRAADGCLAFRARDVVSVEAQERWLSGATCLVCPQGDAGVAVACSQPAVLDGGT